MQTVRLEYGDEFLTLRLPGRADVLHTTPLPALKDPHDAVEQSLHRPISAPPLARIARDALARKPDATACVVISDNTRPVPYRGPGDILTPVLRLLRGCGVKDIVILVASGTHRPLTEAELRPMLADGLLDAFRPHVRIITHDATDAGRLQRLGATSRGTEILVNSHYMKADIKILTGLVEPHFVAGVSGGRKSICPGICGEQVTRGFHSAQMLDSPGADSLRLEGNPCHEEAVETARAAGADFIVNVTLTRDKQLAGVFSGDMEAAHLAAAAQVTESAAIPIEEPYEFVVTHGGFVGVNHYQCAKAAVEAARAVREGGTILLTARLTEPDPIGDDNYKMLLRMLMQMGHEPFTSTILGEAWEFVPQQWQVQMWARVLRRLGSPDRLFFCEGALPLDEACDELPPGSKAARACLDLAQMPPHADERERTQLMAQAVIDHLTERSPNLSIAVLEDGPYGVPIVSSGR